MINNSEKERSLNKAPFIMDKHRAQYPYGEGFSLISRERHRQITEEGYSFEYDDEYTNNELLRAAYCYLAFTDALENNPVIKIVWPWDLNSLKVSEEPIKNLIKAGALIAAEIDRLIREKQKNEI